MKRARNPSTQGSENSLQEFEEFAVAQEPWCSYKLEDGTLLRCRFVLMKVGRIYSGRTPKGAQVSQQTLVVTEVPRRLHGPPGTALPVGELQKFIEKENLGFQQVSRGPSIYVLGDGRMVTAQLELQTVSRTSVFDKEGQPQYLVTTGVVLSTTAAPPSIKSVTAGQLGASEVPALAAPTPGVAASQPARTGGSGKNRRKSLA